MSDLSRDCQNLNHPFCGGYGWDDDLGGVECPCYCHEQETTE